MAVTTKITESKLKLNLQKGLDDLGEPVLKSKTFSNIASDAVDSDLYEVAEIVGGLQELPVVEIVRVNQIQLSK